MTKKHTILKSFLIIICCYAFFAGIVLYFYHSIRYDPEDGAATDFLHMNESLKDEIGEIKYVARRSAVEEIEDERGLHIAYSVETYGSEYHIQVHFCKEGEGWLPYDYTIIEEED